MRFLKPRFLGSLFVTFSMAGFITFSSPNLARCDQTTPSPEVTSTSENSELMLFQEIPAVSIFSPGSQKKENVEDVPGVVSIITREEIKARGYRTLSEALWSIPGFEKVQNDDEYLVPVRGIYATTNQKILIMRDGHALNEPNVDLAKLDYSISLQSIDHIEIIRGPGSSVYGDSAMCAVINIVTVKGNLTEANVSMGDYGQLDYDGIFATKNDDYSLSIYGRYAKTNGQNFTTPAADDPSTHKQPGSVMADDFPGCANFGILYDSNNLTVAFSEELHDYDFFWTSTGQNVDTSLLIRQPNLMLEQSHVDLNYKLGLSDKLNLSFNHYGDWTDFDDTKCTSDISAAQPRGVVQNQVWFAKKFGLNYLAQYDFATNADLMGGVNYEYRHLGPSYLINEGAAGDTTLAYFNEGDENRGAAFAQCDWSPLSFLKLNAGGREDISDYYSSSFNPRLAAMIKGNENWSGKLIYTTALETPGWSYQHSTTQGTGSGGLENLKTETLTSYQALIRWNTEKQDYYVQGTYYINKMDNLIGKNAAGYYANIGEFGDQGVELEVKGAYKFLELKGNYSYLVPNVSDIDAINAANKLQGDDFRNLPMHTINADLLCVPISAVTLDVNARYESSFYPKNETIIGVDNPLPEKVITNLTLTGKILKEKLALSLSVYNVFDVRYSLGDDTTYVQPQPGRWYLVKADYTF